MKHIKRTRGWLAVGGPVLLGVVFLVLWLTPSGSYVFLPDQAHPVAPLVTVKGGHPPTDGGGIYFVDVSIRKATLLEKLFSGVQQKGALATARRIDKLLSAFKNGGQSRSTNAHKRKVRWLNESKGRIHDLGGSVE